MPEIRMPDFERRLEHALSGEIRRERRGARLLKAGGAGAVAAAAATVALSIGGGTAIAPSVANAYPYPAIVYRDAAHVTPTPDEIGVSGAQVSRARAFAVGEHTGYVVPDAAGRWCISVPDLGALSPDVERATACAEGLADLERFGLSVRVGGVVAAAVPPGVPKPIRSLDGRSREVAVNSDDVAVVTDLQPGERFSLRSIDGGTRSHTAPRGEEKVGAICSNGKPATRPADC